ncbi:hypothetical protein HMPREF0083_04083 [Aneurinibacillus aneurinilyticus ATCC 12856]|uniref:Uncharacterized protein n=1 Tax=Aneurinibacillus aneurinilyticus ATCC 12856 TaxID=649747 RepID=U1YAL2_ANEAE|nr:hypothetical protein HMPREF0083_04083 [Aneurinibacillus aneurinilyticus ATCC 12856]
MVGGRKRRRKSETRKRHTCFSSAGAQGASISFPQNVHSHYTRNRRKNLPI